MSAPAAAPACLSAGEALAMMDALQVGSSKERDDALEVGAGAREVDDQHKQRWLYGEITNSGLARLLRSQHASRALDREAGRGGPGTFLDLGCGHGGAVLCASLLEPRFRRCVGVEMCAARAAEAEALVERFERSVGRASLPPAHSGQAVEVLRGDMFEHDWSPATFVLLHCAGAIGKEAEAKAARELRPGAVVAVFISCIQAFAARPEVWELLAEDDVRMSYGKSKVKVFAHREVGAEA